MKRKGIQTQLKALPGWSKALLGLLILLLLILTIGTIYLNNLINRRLKQMIHEASNGLYNLEYNKVRLNLFSGNLSLYNLQLTADTNVYMGLVAVHKAPRYLVTGEVSALTIKDLHWFKWFTSKSIRADKLIISSPVLNVTQYSGGNDTIPQKSAGIDQMLSKNLNSLKLSSFNITNAFVKYQHVDTSKKERSIYKLENFSFRVDVLALTKNERDSLKKISFSYYALSLKDYKYRT